MAANDDIKTIKLFDSLIERFVERRAGSFAYEFREASFVKFDDMRFHVTIQDVMADAKKGLEAYKS